MLAERRRESGETQGERKDTGRAERHRESGETQGERKDAGREERHRESKETQDQPVQLRRDRYTGHIQDAVYVTRTGLASDIPGRMPPPYCKK